MASDIKSTSERIQVLNNCANMLRSIAKMCTEQQQYADTCTDYTNRAANVDARKTAIQSAIVAVSNELSELASNANMEFQYDWVTGRGSIDTIYVDSASKGISLRYSGGTVIQESFLNALSATDVVRLSGSALNSQHLVVHSVAASGTFAYFDTTLQTESLLARVIKELG